MLLALTLRHRSLPDWSSTPKSDTTVDMVDTVDMVVAYFSSTGTRIYNGVTTISVQNHFVTCHIGTENIHFSALRSFQYQVQFGSN